MIGYPVSGHPLDGTHEFIRSKSKNIGKIYEWLEKRSSRDQAPDTSEIDTEKETEIEGEIQTQSVEPNNDFPIELGMPSQAEILQHMEVEKEDETVNATVIGLVTGIRKIQTKTGGMMLMETMESAGFDLRLVIFSRDYDAYVSKIEEDRILIIDGRAKYDTERDEISISPGA